MPEDKWPSMTETHGGGYQLPNKEVIDTYNMLKRLCSIYFHLS